jgi:putative nucleotidyltransferase with HDIG domain
VNWPRVARATPRLGVAVGIAGIGVAACVGWAVISIHRDRLTGLTPVLAVAAVIAGLGVATVRDTGLGVQYVSASFIPIALAAAFLGPASAFVAATLAEFAAGSVSPTRRQATVINLLSIGFAALLAATVIADVGLNHSRGAFYALLAAAAASVLLVSFAINAVLYTLMDGPSDTWSTKAFMKFLPSAAINSALAVAGAAIYVKLGLAGVAFALTAVFGFGYMAHLVSKAEERARAHSALSWGVLGGLLRALDLRDPRAARHAAAVAAFARDIAAAVGMSKHECELAHTAGLLHDIGRFALSDRVHERGQALNDEDWAAIHRHPALGADMLRDIGLYGPVAEIVLAHHERVDGRGYPRGLPANEIPEIAKIIAVAEVYDTLTAKDTYRTRMSSFEALRELRRVKGSQLDGRYVEVLAELLSGRSIEYRHADAADFDTELDIERRINDAAAG